MRTKQKADIFSRFTSRAAAVLGHAWVFVVVVLSLLVWGISGPLFGFSDSWQLIINSATNILTLLMVVVIQNTQNRDNLATNIKLDAIMKKLGVTGEDLLDVEDKGEEQLEKEKKVVQSRAAKAKNK